MSTITFPQGKRFAFTIIDDTDCATIGNVRPVYEYLHHLGFRTTKTVWPLPGHHPQDRNAPAQTLADADYLEFIRQLQAWGFEIALHNARSYSCPREETLRGLEEFRQLLGDYPSVQANHMFNHEALYWGTARLDLWPVRRLFSALRVVRGQPEDSEGHRRESHYFWGDLCQRFIQYVRGFTFSTVNVLRVNPTLPYHDPKRPYVRLWFSANEAMNVTEFNRLLDTGGQEQLEQEGGICIVATHLASGFVRDNKLNPETMRLLTQLAQRPGWYVPVSELLDFLVEQFGVRTLPAAERRRMEWYWLMSRARLARYFY